MRKGPTRTVKYKSSAAKALLSVVREASVVLSGDQKRELWARLWPAPLHNVLTGHAGDKTYITLHESGFLCMAHAYLAGCAGDDQVLATIVHGITRQSGAEVRVAAITALEGLMRQKPAAAWSAEDIQTVTNLILFCLADKFVSTRERVAAIILSASFDSFPPLSANLASDLDKVTAHQESRSAIDKLRKRNQE